MTFTQISQIRSTFYAESTLGKLLCKPNDQVTTEDKKSIFYETDCSKCEVVYFDLSKRSLKPRSDEQKRSVKICNCQNDEIAKPCWNADHNFSWNQKKVAVRESRLIPTKIKETMHSLKNPNQIEKISYMLTEMWVPNLRKRITFVSIKLLL